MARARIAVSWAFVAGALVLAAASCKRAPSPWSREALPSGTLLGVIAGTSDHDLWGLAGRSAFHFDGTRWTELPIHAQHVSVVATDDVWFAGFAGYVAHWDGTKIDDLTIAPAHAAYHDAFGMLAWPGEVWVTFAETGYYRRAKDGDWTLISPPALADWKIRKGWGPSPDDVWLALEHDTPERAAKVAHLSHGAWTVIDHWPGFQIRGSGADDVWLVGTTASGHWDGKTLQDVPTPTDCEVRGVASRSPTEAFAVGKHGCALRWNGTTWQHETTPEWGGLTDVFAAPGGHVHAVGLMGTRLVRSP